MVKFKLKLNQNELKLLVSSCLYVPKEYGNADDLGMLSAQEMCIRMSSRLASMFRTDKQKYNIRLNATEAQVLYAFIVPCLQLSEEPWHRSVGYGVAKELDRQLNHEMSVFNAMYHHEG